MSRAWMWFILSCKRYFRRISFLLILFLLPAAVRGIRSAEAGGGTEVKIAVFAEGMETEGNAPKSESGDLPLEQILAKRLVSAAEKQEESLLQFYICGSEQQVKDEVASRRAECGYVIGENLRERLAEKDYKRIIRVYSAPSTVAASLSTEVVFSVLMELYDGELLAGYAKDSAIFDSIGAVGSPEREQLAKQAGKLYETWLYNGSTFRFTSGLEKSVNSEENEEPADSVFPVRGIVAVYIFIIGLYAAAMNLSDEKKGLFFSIPYGYRTVCRMAALTAPVFLAALSGLAALWSGNAISGFGRELPAILLYMAAVVLFSWLLRCAVGNPEVIYCLLPFFLIGSLVFCPVVIDIGRYLPAAEPVQKLFLPWHYLHFFN